jgi:hypothetical protein
MCAATPVGTDPGTAHNDRLRDPTRQAESPDENLLELAEFGKRQIDDTLPLLGDGAETRRIRTMTDRP